jgi:DNA-binding GntR family transcriptional regulator
MVRRPTDTPDRPGADRPPLLMSSEDYRRVQGIARDLTAGTEGPHEAGLHVLRAAILDRTLAPGARLPQEDLATLMQTGRIPVRRWLRILEIEGLVRSEPHRGYTVTDLGTDDIEQIYHLRIVLESHAVRVALPLLTADDLAEIERIHDELMATSDPALALVLRDRFRARLYAVGNRPRLTDAILRLRQEVARAVIGRPHHHRPGDLTTFLAAVKAGDADAAVADLTAHYELTSALLRRYLRERRSDNAQARRIGPSSAFPEGRTA